VTTKGYEGYEYTLQQWEVDCAHKTSRTMSSTDYGAQGAALDTLASPQAEWEAITPGSITDALYEIVCPAKAKAQPAAAKKP
jgi:hypothetical protein